VTGLLIVGFWSFGAFAPGHQPVGIEQRDGHYYAHYKFERVVEISHEQYQRFDRLHRRHVASVCGMLYAPGVGLGIHAWWRRARRAELADPDADPAPPRRRHRRRAKARRHSRRKRDRRLT
jgi:hypothetical protein